MTAPRDEFYVGYLPLPPQIGRSIVLSVCLLALASLGAAFAIAATHRPAGEGVWDTGHEVRLTGFLRVSPYPYLTLKDGSIVFLVELGKKGARQRAAALGDGPAICRGWAITRDGRRILELAPEPHAISHDGGRRAAPASRVPRGPVEFTGEIVDYKCYLGAMKPGDGKGHKACAALCISNGIPPVLVSRTATGTEYLVLTDPTGTLAFNEGAAPLAGEPVIVTGDRVDEGATSWLLVQSARRRDP